MRSSVTQHHTARILITRAGLGLGGRVHAGEIGSNLFRRTAFWLLWLVVFMFPWEGLVVLGPAGTLARILGYCATGVAVLAVVRTKVRPLGTAAIPPCLFLAWCTLSVLWSVHPDATAVRLGVLIRLVVFAWMLWEFGRSPVQQTALLNAYLLGCGVSVVSVFLALLRTGPFVHANAAVRYTGGGMNHNELAGMLAISTVVALILSGRSDCGWGRRLVLWAFAVAAVVACLLTGSRTGMILLLTGLLFLGGAAKGALLVRGATISLLLCGMGAALFFVPAATQARLASTGEELRYGSWSYRRDIFAAGFDVAAAAPLVGIGWGAFPATVQRQLGVAADSHNTYLGVQCETGLVGTILFWALPAGLLLRARTLQRQEGILWTSILVLWAVSCTSGSMDAEKLTWFIFGVGSCAASAYSRRQKPPSATHFRHSRY